MKGLIIVFVLGLTTLMSSCSSGWTEEERAAFTQSCESSAQMAGDSWPKETCGCLTKKLETTYPNPNDMVNLLDSLQKNPILLFDKYPDCRIRNFETPVVWTEQSTQAFLSSCNAAARKGFIPDSAICPCVLDKVKKRFPSQQLLQRMNTNTMAAFAEECLGKRAPILY
jgi:hypothetical protein